MIINRRVFVKNIKMLADACTKTNSFSYINGIKAILTLAIFFGHSGSTKLGFPTVNGKFVEDFKNSFFCNAYTVIYALMECFFIIGGMMTYISLEREFSRR